MKRRVSRWYGSDSVRVLVTALAVSLALWCHAQPKVIYQNDFSTRRSLGPAAEKEYSMKYILGELGHTEYSDTRTQDGWRKGLNPGVAIPLVIAGDNNNQCVSICHTNAGAYAIVRHPIGNTLNDGKVRFYGDARPPRVWNGTSQFLRFQLGYKRYMSMVYADSEEYFRHLLCAFGIGSVSGSNSDFKFRASSGDVYGDGGYLNGSASVDTTHWYRFVVEMDLDTSTYTVVAYDMGTAQPTLDTPLPAAPVETFNGATLQFVKELTPETGGLMAVGLAGHGVAGGLQAEVDVDLTARYDNLVLESKPQGATEFKRIYANDFTTRTFTRTVPAALEYTYASDVLS